MEAPPEIIAFDVETTGLNPTEGDRIIEIALILIKNGVVTEKIVTLINPSREIPSAVYAINKITDDMVKNSPCFSEIAQRVFDFIKDKTLLAHNSAFDISFLQKEFNLCGMDLPPIKIIDTLEIAKKFFQFPKNSLSHIASHYNLKPQQLHRAETDAMTTYMIYRNFLEKLRESIKCKNYI